MYIDYADKLQFSETSPQKVTCPNPLGRHDYIFYSLWGVDAGVS
jgi:hypothetical protein